MLSDRRLRLDCSEHKQGSVNSNIFHLARLIVSPFLTAVKRGEKASRICSPQDIVPETVAQVSPCRPWSEADYFLGAWRLHQTVMAP